MQTCRAYGNLLLPAVMTLLLTGCYGGTTDPPIIGQFNATTLYFYNQLTSYGTTSPDSVTATLAQGSPPVPVREYVPYSDSTDAPATRLTLDSSPAQVLFTLQRASDGLPLGSNTLSLENGAKYTLVAFGDLGNTTPTLRAYRQNPTTIAATEIRIRFIHTLSQLTNVAPLTVSQGGTALVTGLDYGFASGYVTLNTGSTSTTTQSFDILQGGSSLTIADCQVQPGDNYDAIIAYTDPTAGTIGLFCHPTPP